MSRLIHLIQFLILKPLFIFSLRNILRVRKYTLETIFVIYQMDELVRHAPPGAIVEAGCWKGGLGAYMALSGRDTYLFDSFDGLPETSEKDSDMRRTLPLKQKTN